MIEMKRKYCYRLDAQFYLPEEDGNGGGEGYGYCGNGTGDGWGNVYPFPVYSYKPGDGYGYGDGVSSWGPGNFIKPMECYSLCRRYKDEDEGSFIIEEKEEEVTDCDDEE